MSFKPGRDSGMSVSTLIIDNHLKIEGRRNLVVYFFEETYEFLVPVAEETVPDDRSLEAAE